MGTLFSDRDWEILETLTHRVRFLSVDQIARTWWRDSGHARTAARHRLKRLESEGWVRFIPILSRPEIPMAGPVCSWKPNDPEPDLAAVSYHLNTRWTEPAAPFNAVIASSKAAAELGGKPGKPPRSSEQTHDLHLSAVYLFKREHAPNEAKHWVIEDLFPREMRGLRKKIPDAMIWGRRKKVIEWGGEYSKRKLEALFSFIRHRNHALEIW